jgi:RNase P/RNase MRP subunit p30|tara:strand:- start:2211 stop:2465 length:255 start_codon:yes stop_codon:yes gene_type:complete
MSYSVKLEKLAREKQKSRDIVKEILKFGVSEQQKLDIISGLVVSLENNQALKDLSEVLKNYREIINKEEETDNNVNKQNKIILE